MDEFKVTLKDIEDHAQRHGRRKTMIVMSKLGQQKKFIDVIQSDIGQQLLKDIMVDMDRLLEKNLNMDLTDEERIEYKVLDRLSGIWIDRIHNHLKTVKRIKGEAK